MKNNEMYSYLNDLAEYYQGESKLVSVMFAIDL